MIQSVLEAFGLNVETAECVEFGDGLINNTWKVSDIRGVYILQKVNTNVFSNPKDIADNMAANTLVDLPILGDLGGCHNCLRT
ncbi:MAG: hypothetical protein EOO93_24980 [Pedobacter sp.]|nr:MAG: hypothetical protein EOO93_24980 [Pedobacter sp.]